MPVLATDRFGDPRDPALVLVMGATASRDWWPVAFCQGLAARGLCVLRYDNRDTGQSPTCPPGAPDYRLDDLADDILSVLDAEGIASAHVMGMSLGGYLAQMAALTAPARVLSLILYASEPLGWTGPELPGIADGFFNLFADAETLDWTDADAVVAFQLPLLRFCAGSAFPFDAAAGEALIRGEHARAINPASAFNHGSLRETRDWTDATARISQQTLVIHGTDDPILPIEKGRALAASIPGARLVEIPGLGHEIPGPIIPRLVDEVARFVLGR